LYKSCLYTLVITFQLDNLFIFIIEQSNISFALMEVRHAAPARLVRPIALVYARALGSLVPDSRLLFVLRWHCATLISLMTDEDKLLSNLN